LLSNTEGMAGKQPVLSLNNLTVFIVKKRSCQAIFTTITTSLEKKF